MIVVVERGNAHRHAPLLEEMFRLRAQNSTIGSNGMCGLPMAKAQSVRRRGTRLVIYTDDSGSEVKGSLRLLPTTGPTLAADVFSDTLPDAVHLSSPTIWECSRFCLDEKTLTSGIEGIVFASRVLIAALGDIAIRAGIKSVIGNFDASKLRLYRRIGCEVEVLGSTSRYGSPVYLGLHPFPRPS